MLLTAVKRARPGLGPLPSCDDACQLEDSGWRKVLLGDGHGAGLQIHLDPADMGGHGPAALATRVADFASRMLGPEAILVSEWSKGMVYAPGYAIMGGTSNIMRNIFSERVLGLPREPRT